jgi:hypothetical protein
MAQMPSPMNRPPISRVRAGSVGRLTSRSAKPEITMATSREASVMPKS